MAKVVALHSAEVLLALIFILGGAATLRQPGGRVAQLQSFHIPLASVALRLNALLMIIAGLSLAVGFLPQIAGWVLFAILIPTTIVGHAFWRDTGLQRQMQLTQFLKNLGLLGGLLLIVTR